MTILRVISSNNQSMFNAENACYVCIRYCHAHKGLRCHSQIYLRRRANNSNCSLEKCVVTAACLFISQIYLSQKQSQTAVTAHLKSERLLLFAFAERYLLGRLQIFGTDGILAKVIGKTYPENDNTVSNIPANKKHLYNICTMLDQRRRRWDDVVQMVYKCFVFAGVVQYKY